MSYTLQENHFSRPNLDESNVGSNSPLPSSTGSSRAASISSDSSNNVEHAFGSRIKMEKPDEPSTMTYRQRVYRAQKIKESIERDEQEKDAKSSIPTNNNDDEEEEDIAALFFEAGNSSKNEESIPTLFFSTESTSKKVNERELATNLGFGSAGLANEDNDNPASLILSADTPASPKNSNTPSGSSSNLSLDDSMSIEFKSTCENATEMYFTDLAKSRSRSNSDNSDSESKNNMSKQTVPTMKTCDGSTDGTAGRFFGSLGSDNDNDTSYSDSDYDFDLNESSKVPIGEIKKGSKSDADSTKSAASIVADLAEATNSGNDDNCDSDSDSNDGSKIQAKKIEKETKIDKDLLVIDAASFFAGLAKASADSESDSDIDNTSKPPNAITNKGPKASAINFPDSKSDSDSDDISKPSKAIRNEGPKASAINVLDSESDSDSDSDDSSKPLKAIIKEELPASASGTSGLESNSDSDDSSKPLKAIINERPTASCINLHDLESDSESDDSTKHSEAIINKGSTASSSGTSGSESDSDSDDSSKPLKAIIHERPKSSAINLLDCDSDDGSKPVKARINKSPTACGIERSDSVSESESISDSDSILRPPKGITKRGQNAGADVRCDSKSDSDSDVSSKLSRPIANSGIKASANSRSDSNSDSDSDDSSRSPKGITKKGPNASTNVRSDSNSESVSDSDSDSDDSSKPSRALTNNGLKASSAYRRSDFESDSDSGSDSDDCTKPSETITKKGQESSANGVSDSESDSDSGSDSDDSSKSSNELKDQKDRMVEEAASYFGHLTKASNRDNSDSSDSDLDASTKLSLLAKKKEEINNDKNGVVDDVGTLFDDLANVGNRSNDDSSDSSSDSDENSEASEYSRKEEEPKNVEDGAKDDARMFFANLAKSRDCGSYDTSDSDSGSDSECSSKISQQIGKTESPKQSEDGSTNEAENGVAATSFNQDNRSDHDLDVDDIVDEDASESVDGIKLITKTKTFKKCNEESINDPEAFFANLSKVRDDSVDDIKLITKTKTFKKCDEEFINDPEAFFANLSKVRDDSVDDIKLITKSKTFKKCDEESINDPEAFFANLSKVRDDSVDDIKLITKTKTFKKCDEGSSNDPEAFFANLFKVREGLGSENSKSDSNDSSKIIKNIDRKEEPKAYKGEDFGHSYEKLLSHNVRILVGSNPDLDTGSSKVCLSSDDIQRSKICQPFVRRGRTTDLSGKQYESPSHSEEERILFLHEDMRNIGLSPTIMVHRDDRSRESSIGEDSYLEDLLEQREAREDEQREEIMEAAFERYKAITEPKSDLLFIEILDEMTKEKKDEFSKRNLIQDKLISKELGIRAQRKGDPFSGHGPKEQPQDDTKKRAEAGRSLFAKTTHSDEQATRSVHGEKKKNKGTKPIEDSPPDKRISKRIGKTEDTSCASGGRNDSIDYGRKLESISEDEYSDYESDESYEYDSEESNDGIKYDRKLESVGEEQYSDDEYDSGVSNNDIECGHNSKSTLPVVAEHLYNTIPGAPFSSSSSVSSSSSDSRQLSVNGFEDEYYYDEERAAMMSRRKAIRLLEQEAQLSQREFKLTRKMMLASTFMCCLSFGLLLIIVIDPLDRGFLLGKSSKL